VTEKIIIAPEVFDAGCIAEEKYRFVIDMASLPA
jgi:hypothetical protein